MQDLIAKAEMLLEAFHASRNSAARLSSSNMAGSFMDSSPDADVRNTVARDLVFLEAVEINPVVVHGGGKAITRAMEKAGLAANFIQGQRVTDEATVQIVDDVLSREINPEVVATIEFTRRRSTGFCRHGHFQMPQAVAGRTKKIPARKSALVSSAKSSALIPRRC